MNFGLVFQSSVTTHTDVAYAEKCGFSHAWLYDSQMLYSDAFVTMTLCAANTSKIVLGTGVTNPMSRIAPVTANAFATINQIAPGRVVLGIGTGNTSRRTLGMPAARMDSLRDHVRVCRDLLQGKTTDYTEGERTRKVRFLNQGGEFYNTHDEVPIYVGASGPKLLALAGEIADGVILFGPVSPVLTQFAMQYVRAGAEKAGRNPDDLYVTCMTAFHITEPGEDLESDAVRRAVGPFVASSTNIFALSNPDESTLPEQYRSEIVKFKDIYKVPDEPIETRHLAMYQDYLHGFKAEHAALVSAQMIKATTLTGTPDEIAETIHAMAASGVDQVAIQPILDIRQTTDLFAREIFPRV